METVESRAAMPQGCASWQRTALMIAARHGQHDVVVRALETSCSQPQLDVVDEHGNTAVMIAAREGHQKVVEAIVAAGADLSIKNLAGQTAAELAKTEEIRAVIAKGEAQAEAILRSILAMGSMDVTEATASKSSGLGVAGLATSLVSALLHNLNFALQAFRSYPKSWPHLLRAWMSSSVPRVLFETSGQLILGRVWAGSAPTTILSIRLNLSSMRMCRSALLSTRVGRRLSSIGTCRFSTGIRGGRIEERRLRALVVHPRLPGAKEALLSWDASEAVSLARAAGWDTGTPWEDTGEAAASSSEEEDSDELSGDVDAIDDIGAYIARLERVDPRFFFHLKELCRVAVQVARHGADLLFVNASLSPVQQRHLEAAMDLAWRAQRRQQKHDMGTSDINQSRIAVFDRARVVLAIFARRASSTVARLGIELAEAQEVKAKLGAGMVSGVTSQLQQVAHALGRLPGCDKLALLPRSGGARGVTTSFTSSPQITRQKQQRAIDEKRSRLRELCAPVVLQVFAAVDWPSGVLPEEGCDAPFWSQAKTTLAGLVWPPTEAQVLTLVEEELQLEPGDSAGCSSGRFVLSVWQLVHVNATIRAWHIRTKFGAELSEMAWPSLWAWRAFGALTILRRQVQEDPSALYPREASQTSSSLGPGEDELLTELRQALADPRAAEGVVPPASAAAKFLHSARRDAASPLAVASAFWTLAVSLHSSQQSFSSEVAGLLLEGEQVMKAWMRGLFWAFHQLLIMAWPLLDILGVMDAKAFALPPSNSRARSTSPGLDPREPRCTHASRRALAAGLGDQRVEAIVVFGRQDRVRILHTYLQRNLRKNGGVIDKVHFVVFAAMRHDFEYLEQLIEENAPWYAYPVVTGRRLAKIYSVCDDPNTVYLKIDDDIVYISDEAIAEMVRERLRNRCGLVSANVINHAILSAVHQDIGALRHFFPSSEEPGSAWVRNDDVLPLMAIEKKSQSQCVWSTWQCAAWMHESFLSRLADGTECAYDFGWHDFHASGHGHFDGARFLPLPHTRWSFHCRACNNRALKKDQKHLLCCQFRSINMVAFKAEDVVDAVPEDLAEDDEKELSVVHPARLEKRSCAVGAALAAHFSYSRQEDGLVENTQLLARYQQLAERVGLLKI
eukprot:s181_g29.t1